MAGPKKIVRVTDAAGVVDSSVYTGGVVTGVRHCEFNLAKFGGCLGGVLEIGGGVNDAATIERGQWIEVYYRGGLLNWKGRVRRVTRALDNWRHRYELDGAWQLLKGAPALPRLEYGTAYEGRPSTVSAIVTELLTTYLGNTTWWPETVLSDDTSLIEATTAAVADFVVEAGTDPILVLEELSNIGSGETGKELWPGVTAAGLLYMQTISDAAEDVQLSFTVGLDSIQGEEGSERRETVNRVRVFGRPVPTTGFLSNKTFEDSASVALRGRSRARPVHFPGLFKRADLTLAATGYFKKHAAEELELSGLRRVKNVTLDSPPLPWAGLAKYTVADRSVEQTAPIASMNVRFNETYDVDVMLGDVDRAGGSRMAPAAALDAMGQALNPQLDWMSNWLPEADDLETPEETGAPRFETPGTSGEPVAAFGLPDGTVLGVYFDPSAAEPGDTLYVTVILANKGGTVNVETELDAVQVQYVHVAAEGGAVVGTRTETLEKITGALPTGLEVWSNTETGGGYLVPADSGSGWVWIGVSVRDPASYGAVGSYWWTPANPETDDRGRVAVRVIDVSGTGGMVGVIQYAIGVALPGG